MLRFRIIDAIGVLSFLGQVVSNQNFLTHVSLTIHLYITDERSNAH